MPVAKQKFERGKLHSKVENEIVGFLNERKDAAFTSQEIMGGIHFHTDFSTPEISKMSTFAIADFISSLILLNILSSLNCPLMARHQGLPSPRHWLYVLCGRIQPRCRS